MQWKQIGLGWVMRNVTVHGFSADLDLIESLLSPPNLKPLY